MTDGPEGMGPVHDEPVEATPASSAMGGDFSSGEGLVAIAGVVLLAAYVIFEVLLADYFFNWVVLLLAFAAAVIPRLDRAKVEAVHPLPVVMKVLGYAIAVMGVYAIIDDIRFDGWNEFTDIIASLAAYVAYAMAFVGARQIDI